MSSFSSTAEAPPPAVPANGYNYNYSRNSESLYQQDDLLVHEPHQGHVEIEDAPQETACTPILRKQDAAKRNVPEVDAWRERVENPPSPIPLRDPVEVAHVTEALTSIGEESEKKQGSVQYKEERRRSLENWTKGTVGRAFEVFGLSPSRKAAEKVGGRNLFGGGRTFGGNESQPTSVEQQEVDEFATPGDIKQQHSADHRHDTPHPGPPSTEDESQDVIDKTVSSIEFGEDDAILAGGRASEVHKVDSTNTNASVRVRDSQATASTISSAERSCSSTSTTAGRGAGGRGVTVPVYNYAGGGGSTLGKIAMRFRESVVALPVFSRVLRMREARAVEEGKRDKIGTVVHWSGKTASERAKGPGPSLFSGLYDALSGVFGAGGAARGMEDNNGTKRRGAAQNNFQPGPGEGVPENSPVRSPLFHRLGITSPSKNKNSGSSPAVRFANNTLLTSASSPNLGSGSLFKDPSFDDFDFDHSCRELSRDERYRILLLRNSEEAKKRRQQQNDHRMIESLVKQQAAADKLNPQFRMYRVVCVILSVWFVVACFFLVYAGAIYFTEVVPHLRSTYNEFGAGFRIESQFVHFLEESAFDVVETINHAVQLGFYKEPLYFDQLESFVTPSLVHRRAGVKQLEIGFLGTRLPVVDHGILFRKIGSPASGIQHFVMQSDMYPSCLAIGAFGCVDDLRIPSRDWYKKLAPIRFENLFFVYPIDPLVTFTSSSPAAPWDQGLSSLADGAIAMNEWKWFRYVLSAGSGSGRGLSVDEWRLAYEECRAAGVRGEFCNAGSVGGNGIFGDVLEVGGAGNANGTSSASMAAVVSVGSTTDQTSNWTTSNKNSSGGSSTAAAGAMIPTATASGNATGDLLNATTPTTRQPTTSTSTLTAPTYPELVEGCFSHYQVSQPYLYMHFANDKSEYLSPVTQPPESCYTGPRPSAKWEPEEISKEHAFLKSQKWQRQIYFEWEGPSFISTTETQGPLSSETFDFAPAVGLIFKLQFPKVPIPEEQQKLNLADMVVSHLVGKVSVDLTGCSKFLRDTYVDYVTRNDRDARGVASTDNGEYFDALIVNRQGEIVCARDIMSQVARGGGSRKSGLRFRFLWEKFPDVGLESAQWAKIVQRLDFASPLPAHSGGEVREEGQLSARSRKRRAQETQTAVGGSRFQQDESVYNLGIPPPGGSFAGPDSEAHDAHVRDTGGFDDDSYAVANLLPKDGSFQVHRVRHSRMAGFYVVTRLDDAVFLSSSTSAVFVALIVLGVIPWFLNCCCVLCCFVMREQAVKLKQKKRDKALDEATRTLRAVNMAAGAKNAAALKPVEFDERQAAIDAAA